MPVTALRQAIRVDWTESLAANGPFAEKVDTYGLTSPQNGTIAVASYDAVRAGRVVIAAAGDTTIDLWAAWTSRTGNTKTNATRLIGYAFFTTGVASTASLKVEPGASNPAPTGLDGTSPSFTIRAGGNFGFVDGTHFTLSNTAKNIKLSNPGTTSVTVDFAFLLGGGTNS